MGTNRHYQLGNLKLSFKNIPIRSSQSRDQTIPASRRQSWCVMMQPPLFRQGFSPACKLTMSTMANTPKKKVKYTESLDSVTSGRYHDKLRLINGEDPYETPKKDWKFDPNSLPAIAYPDIVSYFVYSQSAYTLNDLNRVKVPRSLQPVHLWLGVRCSLKRSRRSRCCDSQGKCPGLLSTRVYSTLVNWEWCLLTPWW